ncbi:MAG: alpha/beta hydrolase [Patescibacteria group bacterium]|nr:alpha/beta hydrolase [Patescibacteria group bacterium]
MDQQIIIGSHLISFKSLNLQAGRTAIVFLHGWGSSKEAWQGIEAQLKTTDQAILALDLPGFGASPLSKQDLSIADYAAIVAGFVKKQGLAKVNMVGHSFGGRIGIKLAAQYPELVAKLVLVDSAGFAMNSAKKSGYGFAARLVRPFFKPASMQGLRKWVYKLIGAGDYLATPALQKTFIKAVGEDLAEDMKKIACPTLIVFGDKDTDTPLGFAERMHKLIAGSELRVLAGAGHYSFLDKPEEFALLLKEFIS